MSRLGRLGGVGARLALALAGVVAGALAIVYLIVVPSLENRLVQAKLQQLRRDARVTNALPFSSFEWPDFVEQASAATNSRVVIYDLLRQSPPTLLVAQDSRQVSSKDVENDPVALRAARRLEAVVDTVRRGGGRYAEVAVPMSARGPIVLLSASLGDSLADVRLVQRRLLIAGLIALAIAIPLGYAVAWLFARRIRRLERAADRIARGQFDEPVVDRRGDELGELAAAFEHMRDRLSQLDHARREFIANASHELRTPLFSLSGFLELLRDEELDEETRREFLGTMSGQVERLTKLATELLDLSRLDAGRLRVDREPIDLVDQARDAVDEFAAVARAQERTLELAVPAAAPALGDPDRVLQIARILLENALLHTPSAVPVRLRVAVDDGRALLEVEDEGPGIPTEHAPHVFDRFYRIEGRIASGSGLGLAIARELAERMDGSLELESRPGRTVFRLVLPADAPEALPQPAAPAATVA